MLLTKNAVKFSKPFCYLHVGSLPHTISTNEEKLKKQLKELQKTRMEGE